MEISLKITANKAYDFINYVAEIFFKRPYLNNIVEVAFKEGYKI